MILSFKDFAQAEVYLGCLWNFRWSSLQDYLIAFLKIVPGTSVLGIFSGFAYTSVNEFNQQKF